MNLRHFGYMLYQTTRATYLAQEKNSSLGMIWHLLNPLLMTAVLFLVFSRVQFLQGIEHYSLFILAGLIHYNFFINATQRSAASFLQSRPLILNTTVPLELLMLRQTSIEGLTLFIEVMLVLALGAFMGVELGASLLLYPLVFIGTLALSLGASLFLCSLVVFFSDLNYIWGVFCRLLFFLTPLFFSIDLVPEGFARFLLQLNPLTQLISVARETLVYGGHVGIMDVGMALLGPLLVLVFGVIVFRASRDRIADYI